MPDDWSFISFTKEKRFKYKNFKEVQIFLSQWIARIWKPNNLTGMLFIFKKSVAALSLQLSYNIQELASSIHSSYFLLTSEENLKVTSSVLGHSPSPHLLLLLLLLFLWYFTVFLGYISVIISLGPCWQLQRRQMSISVPFHPSKFIALL